MKRHKLNNQPSKRKKGTFSAHGWHKNSRKGRRHG